MKASRVVRVVVHGFRSFFVALVALVVVLVVAPDAEASCLASRTFSSYTYDGGGGLNFSPIHTPGCESYSCSVGTATTELDGDFWALGLGDPEIGYGADNGSIPFGYWVYSSVYYNYISYSASWSYPGVDGCIDDAGSGPTFDGDECMAISLGDQLDGVGSFAVLTEAVNVGPAFQDFDFSLGGAFSPIVLAPVPVPQIASAVREDADISISFAPVESVDFNAGLFADPGCPPDVVNGFHIWAQVLPAGSPPPTDRDPTSGWFPVTGLASFGLSNAVGMPCATDEVVYFATSLYFDSGFETPYLSANSVEVDCSFGADADGDGIPDTQDNCINDPNASQEDGDLDGAGDACDPPVLRIEFTDPAGDGSPVDVTNLQVDFDTRTGSYVIGFTTTPEAPFFGSLRINSNLYNPDVDPSFEFFLDNFNEVAFLNPQQSFFLNGTNSNLTQWNEGDRVATNSVPYGTGSSGGFSSAILALTPAPPSISDGIGDGAAGTAVVVALDDDGDGSPAGIDCDDTDPDRFPGNAEVCDNIDNDCDDVVDDFVTVCGIGSCQQFGSCSDGVDSCIPGDPFPEVCDGLDNDCNGIADDSVQPVISYCGVGSCATTGLITCVAGSELDSCEAGLPSGGEICDGLDNNCDGSVDEGNPDGGTFCTNDCGGGIETCVAGALTCVPGDPGVLCDGLDQDCDGTVDQCATPTFLQSFGTSGYGVGEIALPIGIDLDADGNIYVADRDNHRIQIFDTNGVFLSSFGNLGSGPGEFQAPWWVEVAPDGTIYVVDSGNSRIQRFDAAGNFLLEWGSLGNGPGQFDDPYALVVNSDDEVFVSGFDSRIQKFTAEGAFLGEWGEVGIGPGQFEWATGMALDAADNLYVVDTINSRIQLFDGDGNFLDEFGAFGTGPGLFDLPFGVAVDAAGNVTVTDYTPSVQTFDSGFNFLSQFGTPGTGPGELTQPEELKIEPSGNFLLADSANSTISRFTPAGTFLLEFGRPSFVAGDFAEPAGIAVDSLGKRYVTDADRDAVLRFDADGNFEMEWGSSGIGPGQFDVPTGIAVNDLGFVYVADAGNSRIQVFDLDGLFLQEWGVSGVNPGEFLAPRGVATDASGDVYVVDTSNARIQKFDPAGTFLGEFGAFGAGPGQFLAPRDIAIGPGGTLFVADAGNDRVQKFGPDFVFLREFGTTGTGPGQFSFPWGIAVDSYGDVWVSDAIDDRIQRFSTTGTFIDSYGSPGDATNELSTPFDIEFGPDRVLLIADSDNRRVNRLGCAQPTTWYTDLDADQFGVLPSFLECDQPADSTAVLGDCDDMDPGVNPGVTELCDGLDNDCDGLFDENFPGLGNSCDTGLLGECGVGVIACATGGVVCSQIDLPASETCDGLDNDCDGQIDDFPDGFTDIDEDGVLGACDNCPTNGNPVQGDIDGDGLGDACDPVGVVNVAPANNSIEIATSTQVTVTFQYPAIRPTVTTATFRVLGPSQQAVPGQVATTVDGLRATFDPESQLAPATLYKVSLSGIAFGEEGPSLAPFNSFFRTEAAPTPLEPPEAPGTEPDANAGTSVAGLGDLNGDGLAEFLSGAPGTPPSETGAALLFLGTTNQAEQLVPDVIFQGEDLNDRAGVSVAGGFDFNNDGINDFLIGAEQASPNGGRAYLIFFDPTEYPHLDTPGVQDFVNLSDVGGAISGVVFSSSVDGDRVGFSGAGGCRTNADNIDDILIGAPGRDPGGRVDAGTVFNVFGSTALSGAVDLNLLPLTDVVVFEGALAGDELGFAVACPGDVMGSVGDDIVMGAPMAETPIPPPASLPQAHARLAGSAEIVDLEPNSGNRSSAPAGTGEYENAGIVYVSAGGNLDGGIIEVCAIGVEKEGTQIHGDQSEGHLGKSVKGGGDNIADGEEDLLMGAPGYDGDNGGDEGLVAQTSTQLDGGIIEVCLIGSDQPDSSSSAANGTHAVLQGPVPGVLWIGAAQGDGLGAAVSGLGDVTGDGFDDIALGAPFANPNGVENAGTAFLIEGAPAGNLDGGIIEVCAVGDTVPGEQLAGTEENEQAGSSVDGAGDVTGDGDPDFVVGAPESDTPEGTDSGTVFVVTETEPAAPGLCGPEGCEATDFETGASVEVPPGTVPAGTIVNTEALLDEASLPAPVPPGSTLLGGASFLTAAPAPLGSGPTAVTTTGPITTLEVAESEAHGAVTMGGGGLPATLPVRGALEDQVITGEPFDLFVLSGGTWVDTAGDGVVGPNPTVAGSKAVQGTINNFGVYAVFIADLDGDGVRDSLDDDVDGDGAANGADNCPVNPNPTQEDCNANGVGDACDSVPCEPMLVVLSSFTVEAKAGGTWIRWATSLELDNAGFRVLRSRNGEEPVPISGWIPAQGSEFSGADYELRLEGRPMQDDLFYLEDVDLFGVVTRHGPVRADLAFPRPVRRVHPSQESRRGGIGGN